MNSKNCAHCSKNILFRKSYPDWIWKRYLQNKGWKYIERLLKWVCPACKLLQQYDQKTKINLKKELMR